MAFFNFNILNTTLGIRLESVTDTECSSIYRYEILAEKDDSITIDMSGYYSGESIENNNSLQEFSDSVTTVFQNNLFLNFYVENSGEPGVFNSATISLSRNGSTIIEKVIRENDSIKCGQEGVSDFDSLSDTPENKIGNAGKFLKVSDDEETIEYEELQVDSVFNSDLDPDLEMPESIGGAEAGTKVSDLQGLTFTQYIELQNFPTLDPTFSSELVVLSGLSSISLEVGAIVEQSLTATFNRGLITNGGNYNHPTDGTSVELVGLPTKYSFRLPDNSEHQSYNSNSLSQSNTFPSHSIIEGTNRWRVVVDYSQGFGNYYDSKGSLSTKYDSDRVQGNTSDYSNIITGKYASFFGYSPDESLVSSQIISLSSKNLVTSRGRTFNGVTASNGDYVYYCYRASYNDLTNIVLDGSSPIPGAFRKLSNVTVINENGIPENYIVYRSNAKNAFNNNSLTFE